MLDQLKWLGDKDEVAFSKKVFKGQLAGKSWKYAQHLDSLIGIRAMMFVMILGVLKPVLMNYIYHQLFMKELLIERLIYAVVFVVFNKFRHVSILIACVPMILILWSYLFIMEGVSINTIASNVAILIWFLAGFYHNYKLKSIRQELEPTMKADLLDDVL